MNRTRLWLGGIALAVTGCSQSGGSEQAADINAATNTASAKKHPTYCFFKDAETKAWKAKRDDSGNAVVTGKAHVKDARYKAVISEHEIAGQKATLWLTITDNPGYAAPENWWDVSTVIPSSSAVTAITVQCGKKVVAELSPK